jgi:very-short-patch-repair endonuclease
MRYTKETLINKLNIIHNSKYDYSLVIFNTVKDKIKIICQEHGIFEQGVMKHLNKSGCKECGYNSNKLTLKSFIDRCSIIHNNFYDYSLVDYKKSNIKVKIICPEHGIFEQQPSSHLKGQTCKKCVINKFSLKIEDFIKRSNITHGNKYDYSLSVIINGVIDNIKIICPEHGEFQQNVSNHLNGNGCKECSKIKLRNNNYIDKCNNKFNNKYDYSLVDYINNKQKCEIICHEHGIFKQTLKDHLKYDGCPYCSGKKMNTELFIKKCTLKHNNFYDYSNLIYRSAFSKIEIICPNHGIFEQMASIHIFGSGCPVCKSSKGEKEIIKLLKEAELVYIHQKKFDDCVNITNLVFDFYIPDRNLCIEYNGIQHYKSIKYFGGNNGLKIRKKRDNIKKKYCENNKISFKIIKYNEDIKNKINEILNGKS